MQEAIETGTAERKPFCDRAEVWFASDVAIIDCSSCIFFYSGSDFPFLASIIFFWFKVFYCQETLHKLHPFKIVSIDVLATPVAFLGKILVTYVRCKM